MQPAFPAGPDWRFDPSLLTQCVQRDPHWKARRGFPADIEEILHSATRANPPPAVPAVNGDGCVRQAWEHVILDVAEHLLAALVLVTGEDGAEKLLGFEARQEGWTLATSAPVIAAVDWPEVISALRNEPTLDEWRSAWLRACQEQKLAGTEVEACSLTRHDDRVEITAPCGLAERLQSSGGELWLLAGSGTVRRAARRGGRPPIIGGRGGTGETPAPRRPHFL